MVSFKLVIFSFLFTACPAQVYTLIWCAKPLTVVRPGSTLYEDIRGKSLITRKGWPAGIATPVNAFQVAMLIRCARKANMKVCARAGGHALDGRSLCNNGLLLDLSRMRNVEMNTDNGIATIQPGATLGETLWGVHKAGYWFPAGTCPGVGAAGYLLGGGIGPYEGVLGLACDSLEEVYMVTHLGNIIKANKNERKELFWAMCGVGGGHFGIITEFKVKLQPSKFFDNSVVFRYNWPHWQIGKVVEKFIKYKQASNDVWARIVYGGSGDGMTIYGVCYNAFAIEECKQRLRSAEFFNVTGRTYVFEGTTNNALHVAGYFGPGGGWASKFAPNLWKGLIPYRFSDAGTGNENSDQSAYLKFGNNNWPTAKYWQDLADLVRDAELPSNKYRYMQINVLGGRLKKWKNNAFAHRYKNVLIHYELKKANSADQWKAFSAMEKHIKPYYSGVYPNYPNPRLGEDYPALYWGDNYRRLQRLKYLYDPTWFFKTVQPIVPLA